jgi:hypothetical protein
MTGCQGQALTFGVHLGQVGDTARTKSFRGGYFWEWKAQGGKTQGGDRGDVFVIHTHTHTHQFTSSAFVPGQT